MNVKLSISNLKCVDYCMFNLSRDWEDMEVIKWCGDQLRRHKKLHSPLTVHLVTEDFPFLLYLCFFLHFLN